MDTVFQDSLRLTSAQFDACTKVITQSGGIVSQFKELREGDWRAFASQQLVHKNEFTAHVDNNVLARLDDLFQGKSITDDHRAVAALMAIANAFGMGINSTFGSHEYALTATGRPDKRLAISRAAFRTSPKHFADIVTGEQSGLPGSVTFREQDAVSDFKYVRGFSRNHMGILKILAIKTRDGGQRLNNEKHRHQRMLEYLSWVFEDFLFGSVVLVALEVFGQSQQGGVLKNAGTLNSSKLLKSARNAAFDLTILEGWLTLEGGRAPYSNPVHLLFTFDKALSRLANRIAGSSRPGDKNPSLEAIFAEFWSPQYAETILRTYLRYVSRCNEGGRTQDSGISDEDKRRAIDELQAEIRQNLTGA